MRNLDNEIKEAITYLDKLGEEYQQKIFEDTQTISDLYPPEMILECAVACAEEQRIQNNLHISFHRKKYNDIKSFKDKKDYYDKILTNRELGFRLVQEKLNNFINSPKIKPYEYWVSDHTLMDIKNKGLKDVIRDQLLFGNLI